VTQIVQPVVPPPCILDARKCTPEGIGERVGAKEPSEMTKDRQLVLAFSLLSTTFVSLCVNFVIWENTRSPLSIAGIVISAVTTIG